MPGDNMQWRDFRGVVHTVTKDHGRWVEVPCAVGFPKTANDRVLTNTPLNCLVCLALVNRTSIRCTEGNVPDDNMQWRDCSGVVHVVIKDHGRWVEVPCAVGFPKTASDRVLTNTQLTCLVCLSLVK